jgi:cell division protein FtsW
MFQTIGETTVSRRGAASGDRSRRRTSKGTSPRRSLTLGIDVPLLLVTIALSIFGLLMVYSASWDYSLNVYGDPTRIIIRQTAWLGLGVMLSVLLTWLDYHYLRRISVIAMAITVFSLFGVLIVNEVRNGAVRTLLGGSVQPSELAKLVVIIYLAVWLYSRREQLSDVGFGLIPLAAILGLLGGLIVIQPDLSAVVTIFLLGGILFFLAGGDLRQIFILVFVAIIVGGAVVLLNPTGNERIATYLPGLRDPAQAHYHVRRSLEAFVKGGWFGVGIGKAETKLTGLPVPPTDSIFAVVGEETGVFGAAVLVGLYILLLWRGLKISRHAPDGLGSLLAAGLTIWLVMEAFVNMMVMLNLLPFAGNALPFISAGGSNLLVSFSAIGILMNISRQSAGSQAQDGSPYGAVIDLRRRDRRRRVSGARRSASASSKRR